MFPVQSLLTYISWVSEKTWKWEFCISSGLKVGCFTDVLQEVSRLLHGLNCGKPLELVALSANGKALSSEHDFDLQVRVDHFAVELMGN